jgi:hypothetical protein
MPSRSRTQVSAGSLGTPHVSYIISTNKDKVPSIRVYVSSNRVAVKVLKHTI